MSSSTSSFRRWLVIFFGLVLGVSIPCVAASEWLLRTRILPVDGFERIVEKINGSSIPNAAFGDSHAAAVPNFDGKDFINLGLGGASIRQMSERVHYYFSRVKPGQIILEADSHLFADYRLNAPGAHIPESYSAQRLAVFDERHRRFMFDYWERFASSGLKPKESDRPTEIWKITNNVTTAESSQPVSNTQPQSPPAAAVPVPAASPAGSSQPPAATATPEKPNPPQAASQPLPPSPPPQTTENVSPAASSNDAPAGESKAASGAQQVRAEFDTFMDYQVRTQTPVIDFLQRDEVRIYAEMIDFLIRRGGKVCLVTYPVDRFYRDRADNIAVFAQVREFYKKLASDRGIPYVSFWARFDDPEMYQNTDHLNGKGAAIFAPEARKACFSGN